jgi:hypothetical protein
MMTTNATSKTRPLMGTIMNIECDKPPIIRLSILFGDA